MVSGAQRLFRKLLTCLKYRQVAIAVKEIEPLIISVISGFLTAYLIFPFSIVSPLIVRKRDGVVVLIPILLVVRLGKQAVNHGWKVSCCVQTLG